MMMYPQIVECANELFNVSRLCPGRVLLRILDDSNVHSLRDITY
jgi:hypothetical protein